MTIDCLASGRLISKPATRKAKSGSEFAVATLRAPQRDGDSRLVNLVCFVDSVREQLLELDAGDSAAVVGELTVSTYVARDGATKPSLSMVVHKVLSHYQVQRKRQASKPTPQNESAGNGATAGRDPDLDDDPSDIPF